MTRTIRIEAPTDIPELKIYLSPNSTEVAADAAGYTLTEVEPRQYEVEIEDATIFGLYRVVVEAITTEITTSIDSGYINLEAADGTYHMVNKLPTVETVVTPPTTSYGVYGPKRVKTKEMEIEQFSPRELALITERGTITQPSFCDGSIRVGRARCPRLDE